jgi:hypothetical protein
VQEAVLCPPYEIGGKPNAERQGGDLPGLKTPLSRFREPSPLFHRGDQTPKPLTLMVVTLSLPLK